MTRGTDERVFPVALKLGGRRCLVVGSGSQATRRARELMEAGAEVHVIAEQPEAELSSLVDERGAALERRGFEERDLDGVWLAVLAEHDPALAARIGREAEARQLLFCAVDQPVHGTFSHMARARAGCVQAAVATSGQAPSLARRLAEELQRLFDAAKLGAFADRLAALRAATAASERSRVLGEAVAGVRFSGELELD